MISFLVIVVVLVFASIFCFMKTLGTRKRERRAAAAAAAEQANVASSSVPANQMYQPYKPTASDLEQMYRATRVFTISKSSLVNEKDTDMQPPSYEEAIIKLQERSNISAVVITRA